MKIQRLWRTLTGSLLLLAVTACAAPAPEGATSTYTLTPKQPTSTYASGFSGTATAAKPASAPTAPTLTLEITEATGEATSNSVAQPTPFGWPCTSTSETLDGHFLMGRPIGEGGSLAADRSYSYGSTQNGEYEVHHGLEFVNSTGTPVVAAADGTVLVAGSDAVVTYGPFTNFYGNLVVIEHQFLGFDEPVYSLYGHVSEVLVNVGQEVESGDLIAKVGAAGVALGSHLHFEVRQGLNSYLSTRNPLLWLEPLTGEDGQQSGVLAGFIRDPEGRAVYLPEITIRFVPEPGDLPQRSYFIEAYAGPTVNGDDQWGENFVAPDLPPGRYKVSFVYGKLFQSIVEVKPGLLTLVGFCVSE